jgi:hypothetical protein
MIMRPICSTTVPFARAALGLTLAAGLVMASLPARAGDDDVPIDTRILRNIMHGLGLKDGSEATINYEERPPLVIPPNKDLPPPQSGVAAVNNPAWPKDPDVERAKMAKKYSGGMSSEELDAQGRPLSPHELAPNAGKQVHTYSYQRREVEPDRTDQGYTLLTPAQLGDNKTLWEKMFHSGGNDHAAKFTGEPPRVSLTEPPPGYQTPSPDQPYGNAKAAAPQADQYYVNHGTYDGVH